MPIGRDDSLSTSEYRLTEQDMKGDLYMTGREDGRDEKGRPLIDWVKPVECFCQMRRSTQSGRRMKRMKMSI